MRPHVQLREGACINTLRYEAAIFHTCLLIIPSTLDWCDRCVLGFFKLNSDVCVCVYVCISVAAADVERYLLL